MKQGDIPSRTMDIADVMLLAAEGGSTLAYQLSQSGLRFLVIERGTF